MKNENWLSILLWGIVFYAVSILSYFTLKVMFEHDSSLISAFGSILSACGTFFAAYIAFHVFNGWRITEDHKTKNGHINNAVSTYFQLQDLLKLKTIQTTNILIAIHTQQALTFTEKIQIIVNVNEIQLEILYILRAFKTHIQLFCAISDNLSLCSDFEQVFEEVETLSQNKLQQLLIAINSGTHQQIQITYDDYQKYITGSLVVDLHLKVLIKISKESKALKKDN